MTGLFVLVVVLVGTSVTPASAAAQSPGCLMADPPPITKPAKRLRFGITPQLAGTIGQGQGEAVPEDPRLALRALRRLEPPRRTLVVRLNRLFESEGPAGIRRFVRLARRYDRAGFDIESQVRYHPRPEQEGDMDRWERFVDRATRKLARVHGLVALTITNEVNLPLSANTSDGAYDRAIEAIVRGVSRAEQTLARLDRQRAVKLGFSYAYRYLPNSDASFWSDIGARATPRFRRALDYVGVQLYPGLFWPPVLVTQTTGAATIEALTLVRSCYMPLAGLGEGTDIWITENGYATNLGHTPARQSRELRSTLDEVHEYSGTLGVTDYRYFNLRDNEPFGTDLFDNVGLLDSSYREKPAFSTYSDGVARYGARLPRPR